MKILDYNDLGNLKKDSVITIGFFDGVHKGHQLILEKLVNVAKEKNLVSIVISFSDDVLELFKMSKNITLLSEKIAILEKLNIDYLFILKKDSNFMNLNASEFIDKYLNKLNCKALVCGSDFSFAKNKEGNVEYLKANSNYDLYLVNDYFDNGVKVSSTYIRSLLENGNIKLANSLLFSPFIISGIVSIGRQIGRMIGFKTANIQNAQKNVLKSGVYFGFVDVDNNKYKALINVGTNPTVKSDEKIIIEAHLLDFDKDIYNHQISITFIDFIREEIKFESIDKLQEQIAKDLKEIMKKY